MVPATRLIDNTQPKLENAHILVVDDEPEIAQSLAEFLMTQGHTVSRCDSGSEALKFLVKAAVGNFSDRGAVDLILLDVTMPGLSGYDVLQNLRNHPDHNLRYTRVIMLTAAFEQKYKVDALNAGADDYITKPYHPQELLARVHTLLRTQQLEKQLQAQREQLAVLNQVEQELAATLNMRAAYKKAATGLRRILNVEAAAVFVKLTSNNVLQCLSIDSDYTSGEFPIIPLGQGIIGQTIARPAIFKAGKEDLADEEAFVPDTDVPPGMVLHSILSLPIIIRGKTWGTITTFNKLDGEFTDFDVDLVASFSTSLSNTIENGYLVQNLQHRQQELLAGRNALQAIIDGILHPIYTITEGYELVSINMAKANEIGVDVKNLPGRRCYEAFFQRSSPCEHCQVGKTIATATPNAWTKKWLGDDHLPREWDVNAYPIPAFNKFNNAQAVVVWLDRTEERRLEQSLLQAGKLAAIGQLAAGVAHEINNPLTAINANAEMLKMFIPPKDDNYDMVDIIHQAGERAAKVVKGLLDFSRDQQYAFKWVELNESIQQAHDLVAYQMNSAGVEILDQYASGIPVIKASPEHLKSVWINMMINARDAMQEHGTESPKLAIITRADTTQKDWVEIVFSDNGPGISEEKAAHIFEPFYTTKDPGKGTGLGLATCLRIIEQHKGTIEVISPEGQGATFIIRLPINRPNN